MTLLQRWGLLDLKVVVLHAGYVAVLLSDVRGDSGEKMYTTTWERGEVVRYFGRVVKGIPSLTKLLTRVTGGMNSVHYLEDNYFWTREYLSSNDERSTDWGP